MLELAKLRVQVGRRPEQQPVQTFKTNRPNQSFDERMRPWNFRNRFDFFYVQDSQICFPLMKLVQRIMVGTEILREVVTPRIACLNIQHNAWPLTVPACMPNPIM